MNKNLIYFDNAATTKALPEAVEAMLPYFSEYYGNPSSMYSFSRNARKAMENAREIIAEILNAEPDEIYFTSGATEANNWALKAASEYYGTKSLNKSTVFKLITSRIEHHSVLNTCKYLEKLNQEVEYLGVSQEGIVDIKELNAVLGSLTPCGFALPSCLVSIMHANNETGVIQPVKELCASAKDYGALFHTDAVQAFAHLKIDVKELGIDMLSASSHKFGGPKGAGFLYIKNNLKLKSFMHGGAQERNRRAGTENIPAIIGMAEAARISVSRLEKNAEYMKQLRDYIIQQLSALGDFIKINGSLTNRLPNNINVSIGSFNSKEFDSEALIIMLDNAGICVSGGSACATGSLEASHVLLAMGLSEQRAKSALRITLCPENTYQEADIFIRELNNILKS